MDKESRVPRRNGAIVSLLHPLLRPALAVSGKGESHHPTCTYVRACVRACVGTATHALDFRSIVV